MERHASSSGETNWYVLRSKPRKEEAIWQQLLSDGFETFYPRLRVIPVNPRSRKSRPYFPGYLFVRTNLVQVGQSFFQWMPYTLGLVRIGGEAAVVPDIMIQAIDKRLQEINQAGGEKQAAFHHGDMVAIQDGPFSGYEAIFDARLPGRERVKVLLKLLGQKQLLLEMPAGQVRRKVHSK